MRVVPLSVLFVFVFLGCSRQLSSSTKGSPAAHESQLPVDRLGASETDLSTVKPVNSGTTIADHTDPEGADASSSRATSAVPALHNHSIMREEREVRIGKVVENWRIVWRNTPQLVCLRWDCACSNFMYAQRGKAELVRSRGGSIVQVFPLASIYSSGFDLPERAELESILPAWPKETGDEKVADDAALAEIVRSRNLVPLMNMTDLDRDGRATEFLLPVGGVGCAFHGQVAVGISQALPEIHILGTAAHPKEPIVLRSKGWHILRTVGRGTYVDVPCDDRGAVTQTEVELKTDSAGIHVIEREYACPRYPEHLLSRVEH